VSFFPWLSSLNYWDFGNSIIVGDNREHEFQVSTSRPVPEPTSLFLTALALALAGCVDWTCKVRRVFYIDPGRGHS
jgi:hypothetical protein